jgi:hypothetical protein
MQVGEDCDVRVEPSGVVQGKQLGAEVPFYVLFIFLVCPGKSTSTMKAWPQVK